jgi:hypothetical protein
LAKRVGQADPVGWEASAALAGRVGLVVRAASVVSVDQAVRAASVVWVVRAVLAASAERAVRVVRAASVAWADRVVDRVVLVALVVRAARARPAGLLAPTGRLSDQQAVAPATREHNVRVARSAT